MEGYARPCVTACIGNALISATCEHPGRDCADGGVRQRCVFPARSAGLPGGLGADDGAVQLGPGSVPVVLPGLWPRLPAHQACAMWPPVCSGRGGSRWLRSGGQPGLSAAILARVRGGRIKVAGTWRYARGPGRLRRAYQPPWTPARCPRCRTRRRPRPPQVRVPRPRCSDAPPAAGHVPGSPMHGNHREDLT